MAYNLSYESEKWKAWVDWGDDFPVMFALYQDGDPVDLTGYELVLGIKEQNNVLVEIPGVVSGNEVTFLITYDAMFAGGMKPSTYRFDFWNKTLRYTYIQEGTFVTDTVAHKVDA